MPASHPGRSAAAPTKGGVPATQEQRRSQEAWVEGFNEGLAGALAGDGYRGVARGALREAADTIDFVQDAPVRAAFIPPMLLGKGITYTTGNDKAEQTIRKTRNFINNLLNAGGHAVTGGMRDLANVKALDPKYLTQDAYNQAVLAGQGGILAADLATFRKLPTGLQGALNAVQLSDVGTRIPAAVEAGIKDAIKAQHEANIPLASHDVNLMRFSRKYKPNGPLVKWSPDIPSVNGIPTSIEDIAGIEALKKEPAFKEGLKQQRIQDYKDVIEYDKAVEQLKQMAKQFAGGTAGGVAGLIAAHQITKRIPALQKRRILRYLLNTLAATGGGYAAWKLLGK